MTAYGLEWLATQADEDVVELWTAFANVKLERDLWVQVMSTQRTLGLDIPQWAVASSEHFYRQIPVDTLELIRLREKVTRHDVKARLEIFCIQAGHEYHHLGMTSADVVDNVMQIKIRRSCEVLTRLYDVEFPSMKHYTLRGIKGAVGTQQDQLDLLGTAEACHKLDMAVAKRFGFEHVMFATGQVYPRSLDTMVLTDLMSAGVRAGIDRGWLALLAGYQTMASSYAGGQWNEGDVSTSVIRRVCIPGAFLALSAGLAHLDQAATGMVD